MTENDSPRNTWDTVGLVCFINILCFYSFYLPSVYLTEASVVTVQMEGVTTFVLGCFTRPFGALIFGLRADLCGIEKSGRESILVLLFSTAAMAFLPTPIEQDYIYSIVRSIQGIGLGGCYACMAVFLYEISAREGSGKVTSLLQSSVPMGYLTALLITIVIRVLFPENIFLEKGWRVAFLIPLVVYFGLRLSRPYRRLPHLRRPTLRDYLSQVVFALSMIRKNWRGLGGPIFMSIAVGTLTFTIVNYKFYFMKAVLRMDPTVVDFTTAFATLFFMPFFFIGGYILDNTITRKIHLFFTLISALLVIPMFKFIEVMAEQGSNVTRPQNWLNASTLKIILCLIICTAMIAIPYGALVAIICRQFPHRIRCFMFAFTYSLGAGVLGGLTQLYSAYYFYFYQDKYTGLYMAVAIALVSVALSVFFHSFKSPETEIS